MRKVSCTILNFAANNINVKLIYNVPIKRICIYSLAIFFHTNVNNEEMTAMEGDSSANNILLTRRVVLVVIRNLIPPSVA